MAFALTQVKESKILGNGQLPGKTKSGEVNELTIT
jgi:hypothetical protein